VGDRRGVDRYLLLSGRPGAEKEAGMRLIGKAFLGFLALFVAISAIAQTPMQIGQLGNDVAGGLGNLQSLGKDVYGAVNSDWTAKNQFQNLLNDYKDLTPQDGAFDPNYTPPGMPEVPVSCAGKEGCSECYTDAYGQLDKVRVNFEQLRVLYGSTMNWTKAEIAFGDSIAGSVGVGGLEWVVQRRKIEASVGTLNKAYDNKYNQLLGRLKQALMAISNCEARQYNDPDWYNRFGYMFYTFMATRYQR
jgi:hypothetical protein